MRRAAVRRRGRRALAALVPVVVLVTGCGSDTAAPADRAVCSDLQRMIDGLVDGRSVDAVEAYDEMVTTANDATSDSPIVVLAQRMASITDAEVDESKLPMSEVAGLAQRAMQESGDALAGLVAECDTAGLPITGVDEAGMAT